MKDAVRPGAAFSHAKLLAVGTGRCQLPGRLDDLQDVHGSNRNRYSNKVERAPLVDPKILSNLNDRRSVALSPRYVLKNLVDLGRDRRRLLVQAISCRSFPKIPSEDVPWHDSP